MSGPFKSQWSCTTQTLAARHVGKEDSLYKSFSSLYQRLTWSSLSYGRPKIGLGIKCNWLSDCSSFLLCPEEAGYSRESGSKISDIVQINRKFFPGWYKDVYMYKPADPPLHKFQMQFQKITGSAFLSPSAGTAKQFIFINFVLLKILIQSAPTCRMINKTNGNTKCIYEGIYFCSPPRSTRYNNGNKWGKHLKKICA